MSQTSNPFDWAPITNWTLKVGSHDFPGPDGGTCINEAAIVAAGFAYKKVQSADDCPPCFSRPFAEFAIQINDWLGDDDRNGLLMPFVLRLSGTADSDEIEDRREAFLACGVVTQIASLLLLDAWPSVAAALAAAESWDDAKEVYTHRLRVGFGRRPLIANAFASISPLLLHRDHNARAAQRRSVKLLDEAMAIGRRADAGDGEAVIARMDHARRLASVGAG